MKLNKLEAIIVERGYTQKKVAEKIGISSKTFYSKMKSGIWNSNEIKQLIELLKIENPIEIFLS